MQVKVMTTSYTKDQIDAAATTQTITVFTTTPNIYIMEFFARVKTAFAGVTSPKVKLGMPTIKDAFINQQGIGVLGDLITKKELAYIEPRGHAVKCRGFISHQRIPSNIPIMATFDSSAGNFSTLTAGEIEFVCVYCE